MRSRSQNAWDIFCIIEASRKCCTFCFIYRSITVGSGRNILHMGLDQLMTIWSLL